MPLQGILNTAHALSFYMRKQEVTANNLANANTDAFKADRITARDVTGAAFPVPVQQTDLQQGALKTTERPLDLALQGDGFFVVRTPQGDRLTRGGSFHLDPAGRLIDTQGNPVMGREGPMVLQGSKVDVAGDGSVTVDGASAGQLAIVQPDDPGQLLKAGFGAYVSNGGLHPANSDTTTVRQGSIEEPNVDPLLSMVDLVTIQRAYAANVDALKAMDSVLGAVTNEVGKA